VLLVVHAYRENNYGEEIVRIISARRAEKHGNPKISGTGDGLRRSGGHSGALPDARQPETNCVSI